MTVSWNNKVYLKIYNYEINNLLNHTTFLENSNRYNILLLFTLSQIWYLSHKEFTAI